MFCQIRLTQQYENQVVLVFCDSRGHNAHAPNRRRTTRLRRFRRFISNLDLSLRVRGQVQQLLFHIFKLFKNVFWNNS